MSNEAPGTSLATLEDARARGDLNVLQPVISIEANPDAASPYLVETVQVIRIIPGVDTYHDFRFANERDKVHALSAIGLSKIAAAAGVKWVPAECRVEASERRPDGHRYLRYRAAGAIRQPNGEWHLEIATRDIDTADEEEDLREAKRRSRDAARSREPSSRRARMTDEQLEDEVRRDVLQIRKFLLAMAETKAKNRVIRRILALRQTYTEAELERAFAVPRLVYRPDVAEANLRLESHAAAELGAGGERQDVADVAAEPLEEEPAPTDQPAPGPAPGSSDPAPAPAEPPPSSSSSSSSDDEPTEDEVWRPGPAAQASLTGLERPAADPLDATTGRKFSELTQDETGLERLRVMTESKAQARAEAARAWLAWAEEASR